MDRSRSLPGLSQGGSTVPLVMVAKVPLSLLSRSIDGVCGRYNKGAYTTYACGARKQEDACVSGNSLHKVSKALDTLESTKWRINTRLLSVVESFWYNGGGVAGLVDRADVPLPGKPLTVDVLLNDKWSSSMEKARKINADRRSQRSETEIRISLARKWKHKEGFSSPHYLDFRGRAYPRLPHLNYQNSDMCRGILEFAEGRPLGKSGLQWLKIHLANLHGGGVKNLPHEGRLAFVDDHLDDIFDSADNPVNGERWWATAEDPFQCLAACINLSEALKSSSPCTVSSHLPVCQDGSCNGLQHYAALGRDSLEAAAVNLVSGHKPSDVYTEIAARVCSVMKIDSQKDPAIPNTLFAKLLIDQVDRNFVKQTVMTYVYGISHAGAFEQVKKKLMQMGHIIDDNMLFSAACYVANVTMKALDGLFPAARHITGWLGSCAKVIVSENQPVKWTTPLGFHVVQPYCKSQQQRLIDDRKQISAFPPNFVHSLDATHMMLTAIACKNAGLHFVGAHDSFWTHACDVNTMNSILREKFVELYCSPVLEELLEGFEGSYPKLSFPPLPESGNFDLEEVLGSPYFFH